jgi:hypothetical protein
MHTNQERISKFEDPRGGLQLKRSTQISAGTMYIFKIEQISTKHTKSNQHLLLFKRVRSS